jgi:hypothetical protein
VLYFRLAIFLKKKKFGGGVGLEYFGEVLERKRDFSFWSIVGNPMAKLPLYLNLARYIGGGV